MQEPVSPDHRWPPVSVSPTRVFLHVGLHKTGTTYVQNQLHENRAVLRELGVDFPGGGSEPSQRLAVWDLHGRRPKRARDSRITGSWLTLVAALNTSAYPTALVSEERLSQSTVRQARRAVRAFPNSDVHVIVTARDLGRVVISAWQEEVKNDHTWTWNDFVSAIKDPARVAQNPARGFWLRQDLVKICETWEAAVPAERIHVVTVPVPGSPSGLLLERIAQVVGFDPAVLTTRPRWANETLGVVGTEVIRRVNERIDGRLNQRQYDRAIKETVAPLLARHATAATFTLPAGEVAWISERADAMIVALQKRGYPVVGDLDELRPPVRQDGREPSSATDRELLDASLDALALLSEKYARAWWHRRPPDDVRRPAKGSFASRVRGGLFRGQRRAAEAADANPVAASAMDLMLKARDRARTRARDRRRRRA